MKKLFIRFICFVLAALCLPVLNAFAFTGTDKAETERTTTAYINSLHVEIEVPAGGRVPSFEATALTSSMVEYKIPNYNYEYDSEYYHNFYKNGIQWYDIDNDRALKEGEAFVTGTRYRVDIGIKLNYGKDLWGIPYYSFDENVAGYINGARADVGMFRANDYETYRQLSYTFPPCEDAPADTTSVSLWLNEPVTGTTPDFDFTTRDVGYKAGTGGTHAINGITWYDAETSVPMVADDKFQEGRRYTVEIELNADSPYMFATNSDGTSKVSALINGNSADVYCNYQTVSDMDKTIWVRYTFAPCKKIISCVEVMGFSLPAEGQKGDIVMNSPDNGIYKVEAITWESNGGTIAVWNGNTGNSSQTGVFEAGVTYTVTVTLAAGTGYAFATDGGGKPAVTASAGGFELEVKEHYAYSSDSYIMVSGRFICLQTYVDRVQIINLEEPLAGKRPDYIVNSIGVGYRIETEREAKDSVWQNGQYFDRYYKYAGVAWYDLTESRYIYEDEVFIEGHVYTVYIDIVADSEGGYEFKLDDEGYSSSGVRATVNDNQALAVSKTSNAFWNQYVEYTVSCQYVYDGGDEALRGDVNADGYIDNLDAAMILKYDAGIIELDYVQLMVGDVNGDGYVDNLDAAMILKYDAGIIDSL